MNCNTSILSLLRVVSNPSSQNMAGLTAALDSTLSSILLIQELNDTSIDNAVTTTTNCKYTVNSCLDS